MVKKCQKAIPFDLQVIIHKWREEFRFMLTEKFSLYNSASSEPENHLCLEADLRFMLGSREKNNKKPVKLHWAHLLFSDKTEIPLF